MNDVENETLAQAITDLDNAICVHGSRIDQLAAARRDLLTPVANINLEGLTDER